MMEKIKDILSINMITSLYIIISIHNNYEFIFFIKYYIILLFIDIVKKIYYKEKISLKEILLNITLITILFIFHEIIITICVFTSPI